MGRFTYPWCSAGMRESSDSTQFQKRGGLLPPQPTGDGDRSIGHHSQSSCLSVRVSFALFRRNTVRRVAPSCHFGFTRFPQPKLTSTKCGFFKDPDFNLTVFMDAEMNPGPPEIENSRSLLTLHLSPPNSPRCLCLYSRETLLSVLQPVQRFALYTKRS